MRTKKLCFFLMLVLLSTWASRLLAGNFFVAPKKGNASFGQEAYPFAMQDRAENRETVEAPPLAKLVNFPLSPAPVQPSLICPELEEPITRLFSEVNTCYILMSLQR